MSLFDTPLRDHIGRALHTVGPETHLPQLDRVLSDNDISGVPVVDPAMRPMGVITRTDLLHAGAVPAVTGGTARRMIVPDRAVRDVMQGKPLCLPLDSRLLDAVALMRAERVHRVLVTGGAGELVGICTVWDVMRAVAHAGVATTLQSLMSPASALVSVTPAQNVDSAVERLRNAHVHGLIVLEDGWPLGVFGQEQALAAERWPEPTTVESWFDPAILVMPSAMRAHRAAAQAIATRCRHILVMDDTGLRGIVTASDFLNL